MPTEKYMGPSPDESGPTSIWANKKKYNEKYEDEKYTLPSRRSRTRNVLAEADEVLGIGRKPKGGASLRTISKIKPKQAYGE